MERTTRAILMDCDLPERDRRNQRALNLWGLAWMAAFVGVTLAITHEWIAAGAPAIGASLMTIVLGLGTAAAYRRYLREMDEMHRKIELDALAAVVGVGVVGGIAYYQLTVAGVVGEADVSMLVAAMAFTYAIAVMIGRRRFV